MLLCRELDTLFFYNLFLIGVQLLYSVVLVSTVQRSEPALSTYTCTEYIYMYTCICIRI